MDERTHLHQGERLLLAMQPAPSFYLRGLLRSVFDALLIGVVLFIIVFLVSLLFGGMSWGVALTAFLICCALSYAFAAYARYKQWKKAWFRVTTDRILIQVSEKLGSSPLHTIKWNQYQEGFTSKRKLFDVFFHAKSLAVRYGNADSKMYTFFPSLKMAKDVKHYLDKADSAIRKGQTDTLQPFVPKPKGKRD